MTHGNEMAFPKTATEGMGDEVQYGLTKREYFAALAMQGMFANSNPDVMYGHDFGRKAVGAADALITALNMEAQ